ERELPRHPSSRTAKPAPGETARDADDDGRDRRRVGDRDDGVVWTRLAEQYARAVQGARPVQRDSGVRTGAEQSRGWKSWTTRRRRQKHSSRTNGDSHSG